MPDAKAACTVNLNVQAAFVLSALARLDVLFVRLAARRLVPFLF